MKKKSTNTYKATREHHSIETAEDYCELILDLIQKNDVARIGNIASALGISHVTAIRTIRRLANSGYLITRTRHPVQLTAKGKKLATYAKERHKLIVDFLVHIGSPLHIAEIDAEGAEHHFSKETVYAIRKFMGK